jgi:ubiquitin-activating enzyme E1
VKFVNRLRTPPTIKQKEKKKEKKKELTTEEMIKSIIDMVNGEKKILQCVKPIVFEKDDDSNHHIDLITAMTNKRAANYHIESKNRLEIKGIAGKIIPAIATTTSVVAGLISLELYKLVYGTINKSYNKISRYRYGSFNLAVQSFGFGVPNEAKSISINNKPYTIWTKEYVSPDRTLGSLLEEWSSVQVIRKNDSDKDDGKSHMSTYMSVGFIADSEGIIYSNMMDIDDEKLSKRNNPKYKNLSDFIKNREIGDHYFTISLEKDNDDDSEDFDSNLQNQGDGMDTMISIVVSI